MSNQSDPMISLAETEMPTEAPLSAPSAPEEAGSLADDELPQTPLPTQEEPSEESSCEPSAEHTAAPQEEFSDGELSSLRRELARLQQELASKEAALQKQEAITREQEEFFKLFPGVPLSEVPKEVRAEATEAGIPLAAAFALYEKKREAEQRHIRTVNLQNARSAPGLAGVGTAGEFLTPEEVRRMSPTEVRANYKTIFESMKKW